MVDESDPRSRLDVRGQDLEGLSADQRRAIRGIGASPWLVQPLAAPAGAGKTHSLRPLRTAARRGGKQVLVLAPTGKAVDEAMADGAGDHGFTVANALHLLTRGELRLDRRRVVVIDEAAMVATGDLTTLLAATSAARCKTVLVGDPYQLAPVNARGGMFEQLCAELPWAQRLSEVWRLRNREERDASLALRSGRGTRMRHAVGWYRSHGRLHTGDPIAMAADALEAHLADRAAGKDSPLICDTWEIADALNRRLHDTLTADGPTAQAARDQSIRVGDIIVSRHNDATIDVRPGPGHRPGDRIDQVRKRQPVAGRRGRRRDQPDRRRTSHRSSTCVASAALTLRGDQPPPWLTSRPFGESTPVSEPLCNGLHVYPGRYADLHPDRPAFIMASTGEAVTYREYEARCNQLAHQLRRHGLARLDHYAIYMENNDRYLETCGAGERSGLYYTCVNSYLTAEELAYIVDNSDSRVLITSAAKLPVARDALAMCPKVTLLLVVDLPGPQDDSRIVDYATAIAEMPTEPIPDECLGVAMLYSSGTTGRPKGIIRPLPEQPPDGPLPVAAFVSELWQYREDMIYLSPAPLYHSAPHVANNLTLRMGGTAIIMEHFDPVEYLKLIEKYHVTHTQLVPTMFSRLLKLPEEQRMGYDLSSLEIAVHAAAPCPAPVKEQMIAWWGPIILEYYSATEALGFTACNSEEWLAHRGSVGKVVLGELHILADDGNELPRGEPGAIWFKTATPFGYHNDAEKTRAATSPDGTMTTVGDVGYVDEDNFLYLTDRRSFMIITGGVNIYPQEIEDLLITHPKLADAAVFGVPNADLGEEVKAVVQPMPGVEPNDDLVAELLAFCSEHLSRQKVPRSIDFEAELPRLPTGKLYKRLLRDRYWTAP